MSEEKYSEDTNPAYKGMLGCFDYLMKNRNQNTDNEVIETKNKMNRALKNGVKDPICRGMIVCAYKQEIRDMENSKKNIGHVEYIERMRVLKNLSIELGIEKDLCVNTKD